MILRRFNLSFGKTLSLLSAHHAIIGGRCALLAVLPQWSKLSDKIEPHTIEFVVPRTRSNQFLADFRQAFPEYTFATNQKERSPLSYLHNEDSFTLTNRADNPDVPRDNIRRVLIHTSADDVAYHAIFYADLTVEMNFISHRGIFSAYPTMTCKGYSLSRSNDHHPNIDIQFRTWGFHVATYPEICTHRGISHKECGGDKSCPYSVRSSLDNESHFLAVPANNMPLTSSPLLPISPSNPCIVWVFNGGKCSGFHSPPDFVLIASHVQPN